MAKLVQEKIAGRDWLQIFAGTFLMAVSVNFFSAPANMVTGGVIGLSMILHALSANFLGRALPIWLGNLIFNLPIFLLATRVRGKAFLLRTGAATLLLSFWMFLLPEYPLAGDDFFLVAIAGGALMGVGLGLVFLGKATTGGTDMLAAILQHYFPHLSTAKILPFVDGAIILLAAFLFGPRLSLYALCSVILSGQIADGMIAGFRNACLFYIISDRSAEIADEIMAEMDRGVTHLSAEGGYTKTSRPVLFCAVSRKQAARLKDLVYGIDPAAFLVRTDANEIRGEGFLHYSTEEI